MKGTISGTPLKDLIADPAFVLNDIESVIENGQELIKFHFSYPAQKNRPEYKKAFVTLIPEYDWALKNAEHTIGNHRVNIDIEYELNKESIPTIKKYSRTLHFPKEKVDEFYEMTFDDVSYDAIPESNFTLTHFGLPEPKAAMPVQVESRMHLWLIGGAVLLFTSAIGLRWAAVRSNRASIARHS